MSIKIPFIKHKDKIKEQEQPNELKNVPAHVAIIMDGNGRWAKKRGLPRIAGHNEGVHAVNRVVKAAAEAKVEILTLYAFSTENWKRPKSEIDYIMKLPKEFLHIYLPELMKNNVRIQMIGEFDELPSHTKDAVNYGIEQTKNNTGMLLNFALNYGGRHEITQAIKKMLEDINCSKLSIDQISEDHFSNYLYTKGLQDPDLLIRTSGEQRISNFLLWQLAYTELWFTDLLWPDFNEEVFRKALQDYQNRKRRFGGL